MYNNFLTCFPYSGLYLCIKERLQKLRVRLGACKTGLSPTVILYYWSFQCDTSVVVQFVLCFVARAPAIRKMVIGGRKVAQISFIPSCRGTHWKLENQCLVNFKSCKSIEIISCILLHMTFYSIMRFPKLRVYIQNWSYLCCYLS